MHIVQGTIHPSAYGKSLDVSNRFHRDLHLRLSFLGKSLVSDFHAISGEMQIFAHSVNVSENSSLTQSQMGACVHI